MILTHIRCGSSLRPGGVAPEKSMMRSFWPCSRSKRASILVQVSCRLGGKRCHVSRNCYHPTTVQASVWLWRTSRFASPHSLP